MKKSIFLCLILTLSVLAEKNKLLLSSAESGDLEEVKSMLAQGADVNARSRTGHTPLFAASAKGHVEIVKLLLAKGADVHAKNKSGRSALGMAKMSQHKEIVKLLEQAGAK